MNALHLSSLCLAASCAATLCAADPPDRASLLGSVEAVRSGIQDIAVDFTVTKMVGHPSDVSSDARYVAWSDGMIRVERTYPTPSGASAFVAATTDGVNTWQYFELTRTASRSAAPGEHHEIDGMGFFELMAFFPAIEGGLNRGQERDLANILADEDTMIGAEFEDVAGAPCIVVDSIENGTVRHRLWVDPQRSFMPRKQEFYFAGGDEVAVTLEVSEFGLVGDRWLPIEAVRFSPPSSRYDGGEIPVLYAVQVDRSPAGELMVSVNSGLAPSHFDYSAELPAGVLVGDDVTGDHWVVSGRDFRSSADAALASLGADAAEIIPELRATSREGRDDGRVTSFGVPWALLTGACIAVGIMGVAARVRRVPERNA